MTAQQLKNAILQEAIQGRLVPQDPNDEPASVLLDKIREEKKQLVKEGKLKKKDLEEKPISEDEIPFEIPESWEWCKFGTIVNTFTGKTPERGNTNYWHNADYPWVSISDMKQGEKIMCTKEGISENAAEKCFGNQISPKGSLIMSFKLTVGRTSFLGIDAYHNEAIITINTISDPNLYIRNYLSHILPIITTWGDSKDAIKGKTLNSKSIYNLMIPLPPYNEQKRIVAKIEELLPKVEEYGKAQEKLNKLNGELPARLKKSILQEAIEGRLVPQDPNDEPASVLLAKIREEKKQLVKEGKLKKKDLEEKPISEDEIPFEIPESWEWCKLGTIATLIGGFAFKSHEYTPTGSRIIRISDITEEGFVEKNVVRYTYDTKLNPYVINKGDILMAMTGGTVGKSLNVKTVPEESMLLNQRVANIRVIIVLNDFIDYVIKSHHIQNIITDAKNSTNDNISMADIYNFPVPLPPLAEQKRIVAKIEQLLGEINKLNA